MYVRKQMFLSKGFYFRINYASKILIHPKFIKPFSYLSPIWHIAIHNCNEVLAVVIDLEVRQLVKDHVFKALRRFLCELKIEPDSARARSRRDARR